MSSADMALRAPGRLRVTVATRSATSSRTTSATAGDGSEAVYRATMTEEPWPKRPWLAVTPTRAPSTWRPAA